jgi:hypothetical protein
LEAIFAVVKFRIPGWRVFCPSNNERERACIGAMEVDVRD